MDNRIYLSVLSAPASAGSINLTVSTYGASPDIVLTLSATGLATSDNEIKLAKNIYNQVLIQLLQNDALYSPPAESLTAIPPATIQITRTDHIICFWSQSNFDVEISSNTTGAIINIGTSGSLSTVSETRLNGPIVGQDYSGLSDAQLSNLINAISSEIISITDNNFVASTYMISARVDDIIGYRLPHYPVQRIDAPLIADPWTVWNVNSYRVVDLTSNYHLDSKGYINYRYAQNIVHDDFNPFGLGNEFRITWVAGEAKIPTTVKMAIAKLGSFYINYSFYEELKGGTSSVKFKDEEKEKKIIFLTLSEYFR